MKALNQISVRLSGHAEEAVSELFESVLGQGPSIYTDADTGVSTASVYLDKPLSSAARDQLSEGLHDLAPLARETKILQKTVRRENWAESWKKHFKPLEVSSTLLIKPSWSKRKPRKGQAVVVLDPGLSFGTGQHATTSFCLRQIVASRVGESRQSFLDIGTGSGILSIAAAKLGYSPIEAFDFDPESIRVARENTRQNKVEKLVKLTQQDLTKLPSKSKQQHDVICANLIFDLLIAKADKIANRLKPNGDLILAGILMTQFSKVKRAYAKLGFKLIATTQEKEWQSGHFRRVG
ncbi:MAG: ribosomal protein methyltransferase [Verrucomicrobiales bacterium]|nr:ribosomal protein methyltransferase [Verrucomicrobiales bacterium]